MERSHYQADGRRDRGLPGTILPDCSSGAAFAPAPTAQSVGAHPAVATLSGSFSLVFEVDRYFIMLRAMRRAALPWCVTSDLSDSSGRR